MHNTDMIENLDAIVNKVVQHIREDSANVSFKNVKSVYYVKSHEEYYDICDKRTDEAVYKNIIDIDFVRAIMYSLIEYNNRKYINEILLLEKEYAKHINDMLCYLNAYKNSKDAYLLGVLEDRFVVSKYRALGVKDKLRIAISILDK